MAGKKSRSKPGRKPNPSKPTQADLADKFVCYQESVQSPEHEIEFFEQAFRDAYGRRPYSLREDFCGTFAVCCEWVKSRKKRTAVGVDLCPETLQWGREQNLSRLSDHQRGRVTLLEDDVRSSNGSRFDVLAAQNFSFWLFKTRREVVEYFKDARANLKPEGVFVLDMMGGGACYEEGNVDKRRVGKGKKAFWYEWEQSSFDPITRDASMCIHFRFQDGSRLDRAFEYHWRFWTLPEVLEMLEEAGFSESHVYWELEDADGEDTGEFERKTEAENSDAWVCYAVGVK
ncbi:MAG: class I SAM-dependent methyltransferase [Planctomycetota bacterium]